MVDFYPAGGAGAGGAGAGGGAVLLGHVYNAAQIVAAESAVAVWGISAAAARDRITFDLAAASLVTLYAGTGVGKPGAGGSDAGLFVDGVLMGLSVNSGFTGTPRQVVLGYADSRGLVLVIDTAVEAMGRVGVAFGLVLASGAHEIEWKYKQSGGDRGAEIAHRRIIAYSSPLA